MSAKSRSSSKRRGSVLRKAKVKKQKLESEETEDVPDYLKNDLDIIFVGFNPGVRSGALGHHYAGRNNQFYNLLYESGLISEKITYEDDWSLVNKGIGLTNIVMRTSASSADLSKDEMKQGARVLIEKLKRYHPKVICFNGMGVFTACLDNNKHKCTIGLQPHGIIPQLSGIPIFVMPSSSARVAQYSFQDKAKCLKELKKLLPTLHPIKSEDTNIKSETKSEVKSEIKNEVKNEA